MNERVTWSDTKLEKLVLAPGQASTRISVGMGLYLRIVRTRSGLGKTWQLRSKTGTKTTYRTLGSFPEVPLKLAISLSLTQTPEPVEEAPEPTRRAKEGIPEPLTLSVYFKDLMKRLRLADRRESSVVRWEREFLNNVTPELKATPIKLLNKNQIRECIERVQARGTLGAANQTFKLLRFVVNRALEDDLLEVDVLRGIPNPKPYRPIQGAEGTLNPDELKTFLEVLLSSKTSETLILLILFILATGCRASEARLLTWDEVSFESKLWTLPAARNKSRRAFLISLSPLSLKLLRICFEMKSSSCDFVFRSRKTDSAFSEAAINHATERLTLEKRPTVHDLRRTFRSLLSRLKVNPEVAERCLNHLSGDSLKLTYDAYDYRDEMKEAWNLLGSYLENLLTSQPGFSIFA